MGEQIKKTGENQKIRKTVNVSLQKRYFKELDSILKNWEKDGYNISSEICEAILFKNKSENNIHVSTIISTLTLIQSTLKSKKSCAQMSPEEIDSKSLEILNDVITIDLDGIKLTKLLNSVDAVCAQTKTQMRNNESESKYHVVKGEENIDNQEKNTEIALTSYENKKEDIIIDKGIEVLVDEHADAQVHMQQSKNPENNPVNNNELENEESEDIGEIEKTEPLVWAPFPEEIKKNNSIKEPSENPSNGLFRAFAIKSDFVV